MNQVLGTTAGNALEIEEAVLYLRNERRDARLDDVTLSLCAEMLIIGGLESDRTKAREKCDEAVVSGRAAEIFGDMVNALGGPSDFVEHFDRHLARAPVARPVHANGILTAVNTRAVGNAIIELGGGRRRVGETLDLSVGFSDFASVGTTLDADTPLAVVHAASEDDAARAEVLLLDACRVGQDAPVESPLIKDILDRNG